MSSVSRSQQKLFGQIHVCQKYGKCSSERVRKLSKEIKKGDVEDFASTKHKGLPERKDEVLDFKDWLNINEVGTTTADVASFARPVFGSCMICRGPCHCKKKKKYL
jgi:hypothetical protein